MGRTTLNIEKDTVLISQTQKRSLFTSNQVEADTRIGLHCSESSKQVLEKTKDTDILILMVYAFALTSPPYDHRRVIRGIGELEKSWKKVA